MSSSPPPLANLFTLTAANHFDLQDLAQRCATTIEQQPELSLTTVCTGFNGVRTSSRYRLALVATSTTQLSTALRAFAAGTATTVIAHEAASVPPKIAFLFTGQGSQYSEMGRSLFARHPVFRETMQRCAAILESELDYPLLDLLYDPELQHQGLLNQTVYTQPALFAIEYAIAQLWQSWGIQPSVVMGHSIGEYVAACVAGVFSLEDGLRLIAARGRLMQALPQEGSMVAVMATLDQITPLIASEDVAIAAVNGATNIVLSGRKDPLKAMVTTLETQGIKVTPLAVSHAFHSPLMEPMLPEFAAIARTIDYATPQIPVISNVTGQQETEQLTTPDYWCRHVRQTVQFATGIQTLAKQGDRLFLEVGPRPILSRMGQQCLPDRDALWLPSLQPGQDDWQQLLTSLGELFVRGVGINWHNFDQQLPQTNPPPEPSHHQRLPKLLLTHQVTATTPVNHSPFREQLMSLPEYQRLAYLKETLQHVVGQVLAGIHPTGSGIDLQQNIPEDMLNRTFALVDEWYKYFGISLTDQIAELAPDATVLDLCCGYGVAANTLAAAYPELKVIGVDLHPDAEQVKKYVSADLQENLRATLIAHDACDMPSIATNSIDFCYCMAGIAYVPDGLQMLREIYRVLKPQAQALLYMMRRDQDIAHDWTLDELLQAAEGGEFTVHPFTAQTVAAWEAGHIPKPYYLDGVILAMRKTSEDLGFPFTFEGSSRSLQSSRPRSMEIYYVAGHYRRSPVPVS